MLIYMDFKKIKQKIAKKREKAQKIDSKPQKPEIS